LGTQDPHRSTPVAGEERERQDQQQDAAGRAEEPEGAEQLRERAAAMIGVVEELLLTGCTSTSRPLVAARSCVRHGRRSFGGRPIRSRGFENRDD